MATADEVDDTPEPGQRGIPTYGSIIRQQRRAKNLTQEQLARLALCDPRVVMKAERGGPISLRKLHGIAAALGKPPGLFANLDLDVPPQPVRTYCEVTVKFLLPAGPLLHRAGQEEFVNALKAALEPFGNRLEAVRVREGSVLVDFIMPLKTLNALCIAQDYQAIPEFAID